MILKIPTFRWICPLKSSQSMMNKRRKSFAKILIEFLSLRSPSGSVSSFHSATSTLSASSMETAEGGDTIFMEGLQPSRTDFQVFKAVETVDVPFEKYPNLFDWLISVKNFSEKEMSGWKSVSKSTKLREKGKRLSFNE